MREKRRRELLVLRRISQNKEVDRKIPGATAYAEEQIALERASGLDVTAGIAQPTVPGAASNQVPLPAKTPSMSGDTPLQTAMTLDDSTCPTAREYVRRVQSLRRLGGRACPKDSKPTVIAFLPDGGSIAVESIKDHGANSVVVTGRDDDGNPCMYALTHSVLKLYFVTEKARARGDVSRKIGFDACGGQTPASAPDPDVH